MVVSHRIVEQIPSLRRYARALSGGNAADADDLVQDTLERAYAKWNLFRSGSRLRPWLFSIMHNLFINELRRPERREVPGSMDEVLAISTPAPQEHQVLVAEILTAVGRLPPDQREVLLLVAVEEFSYAEAARILDIPTGTVMSRLFRARAQLRVLTSEPTSADATTSLRLVRKAGAQS